MRCSYYPYCTSEQRTFGKSQDINGNLVIEDEMLCFHAKLFFIPIKSKDIIIPLNHLFTQQMPIQNVDAITCKSLS